MMAENRVIGNKNRIPWSIPSDQKRFREVTMGHSIIFGRVTFEILGRPLPGRRIIVLTHKKQYQAQGAIVVHSIDEALAACTGKDEVFIGGGGTVFEETIGLADRIDLSVIHRDYEGDSFFPKIPGMFVEVNRREINETPPYSVIRYERRT